MNYPKDGMNVLGQNIDVGLYFLTSELLLENMQTVMVAIYAKVWTAFHVCLGCPTMCINLERAEDDVVRFANTRERVQFSRTSSCKQTATKV